LEHSLTYDSSALVQTIKDLLGSLKLFFFSSSIKFFILNLLFYHFPLFYHIDSSDNSSYSSSDLTDRVHSS